MATPAVDPFDAFFTPDRLAYYRDLHARYLLWCGRWPDKAAAKREASHWSTHLASQDVMADVPTRYIGYSFEVEASEAIVPRPIFAVVDYEHLIPETGDPITRYTKEIEPPILRAFAAAANYVFVPWGTDLSKVGRSARRSPGEVYAEAAHRGVLQRAREIVTNKTIMLTGKKSSDREAAGLELQRIWMDIGRRSGVLSPTKGGVQCTLSDEFLAALLDEAKSLCDALVRFVPDEATLGAVRDLAGGEARLLELDQERLKKMRRDGKPEDRIEAKWDEMLDRTIDSTAWSRRLAFPMLSRVEIGAVLDHMSGKTNRRMLGKAASDMLAGRLPIGQSRLISRVARAP